MSSSLYCPSFSFFLLFILSAYQPCLSLFLPYYWPFSSLRQIFISMLSLKWETHIYGTHTEYSLWYLPKFLRMIASQPLYQIWALQLYTVHMFCFFFFQDVLLNIMCLPELTHTILHFIKLLCIWCIVLFPRLSVRYRSQAWVSWRKAIVSGVRTQF